MFFVLGTVLLQENFAPGQGFRLPPKNSLGFAGGGGMFALGID